MATNFAQRGLKIPPFGGKVIEHCLVKNQVLDLPFREGCNEQGKAGGRALL